MLTKPQKCVTTHCTAGARKSCKHVMPCTQLRVGNFPQSATNDHVAQISTASQHWVALCTYSTSASKSTRWNTFPAHLGQLNPSTQAASLENMQSWPLQHVACMPHCCVGHNTSCHSERTASHRWGRGGDGCRHSKQST